MNNSQTSTAPTDKTLAQWLHYLESIHPKSIDMGLERVRTVAANLNISFDNITVITVAGTNGKGTTCRLLEQVLVADNKKVGVYSSPHLMDYRERVRLNGEIQAESEYTSAMSAVEAARGNTTLTYFEFGTLAAMVMMQKWAVDVAILEVGLGGRLDATNIVDPDIAVITTIGLDHQDWLGDTREKIATEKAGIFRRHGKVVVGEPEPPATLLAAAGELQTDSSWAGQTFSFQRQDSCWSWQYGKVILTGLPVPAMMLQNASTALAVLYKLNWLPDAERLKKVLRQVSLPGRCQQIRSQPRVVVDVAHNPQATQALADYLTTCQYKQLHIVVGMLKDKALAQTLLPLASFNARWYTATTDGPRGCDGEVLRQALEQSQQKSAQAYADVPRAYQQALSNASPDDMILVFGSFLTVADVLGLQST